MLSLLLIVAEMSSLHGGSNLRLLHCGNVCGLEWALICWNAFPIVGLFQSRLFHDFLVVLGGALFCRMLLWLFRVILWFCGVLPLVAWLRTFVARPVGLKFVSLCLCCTLVDWFRLGLTLVSVGFSWAGFFLWRCSPSGALVLQGIALALLGDALVLQGIALSAD